MTAGMVSELDARNRVLSRVGRSEPFAVQSCVLSSRGDYWVIRANSAALVLHGDTSRRYVGVNAYLIDAHSGEFEIVPSYASAEHYLQDKYDVLEAAGRPYVLCAGFARQDRKAIIALRQKLECPLRRALLLAEPAHPWLTGKRSVLQHAQKLLADQGVASVVTLVDDPTDAPRIDDSVWHWQVLRELLRQPGMQRP